MPTIDFKEILSSDSDSFELLARDLLECHGFGIFRPPGRGADGGVDMIVIEHRTAPDIPSLKTETKWLVSCKHYAHSNESVGVKKEHDISDRVKQASCDGFLGFYSTLASSSLINRLENLRKNSSIQDFEIYDKEIIERLLLQSEESRKIAGRYFPKSSLGSYSMNQLMDQFAHRSNSIDPHYRIATTSIGNTPLFYHKLKDGVDPRDAPKLTTKATFKFPKTLEGNAKLDEFNDALRKGERAEIPSEYISEFIAPEIVTDLIGDKIAGLILASVPKKNAFSASLHCKSIYEKHTINDIHFDMIRSGSEEALYSNKAYSDPILIEMIVQKEINNNFVINFKIEFLGNSYSTAKAAKLCAIRRCIAAGADLNLTDQKNGDVIIELQFQPGQISPASNMYHAFLKELQFIENKKDVEFIVPPEGSITRAIINAAHNVHELLNGNHVQAISPFDITMKTEFAQTLLRLCKENHTANFTGLSEGNFNILSNNIHIGNLGVSIALESLNASRLEQAIEEQEGSEWIEFRFVSDTNEEYPVKILSSEEISLLNAHL